MVDGRDLGSIATDVARQRVVMFGGRDGNLQAHHGLFEWDGAVWTEVPFEDGPEPRYGHAMGWDPVNQDILMFGGTLASRTWTNCDETWSWNGTRWLRREPPTSPGNRGGCAIATDPVRQVIVLIGGGATIATDETWEWDGSTWANKFPAVRPTRRAWGAAAYCARSGRVTLFGGNTAVAIPAETWEWDGNNWLFAAGPVGSPSPRSLNGMSATPQGTVLLHGGSDSGGMNDTWEWDGAQWRQLSGLGSLPPLNESDLALDPVNQTVLHVGWGTTGPVPPWGIGTSLWSGNTWTRAWTEVRPVGVFAATWDKQRDERVVLDYRATPSNRLWTYVIDAAGRIRLASAGVADPPLRQNTSFVYHEADRVCVLFSGDGFNGSAFADTWIWDGLSWSQDTRPGGPTMGDTYHCYDPVRRKVVVLSPGTLDMWEYDRAAGWTPRVQTTRPTTPRAGHAMCWSPINGHLVLYGGMENGRILSDTWEFDGSGWTRANVPGNDIRYHHPLADFAYSETLGACVMIGRSYDNPNRSLRRARLFLYDHRSWRQIETANELWISNLLHGGMEFIPYDRQGEIDVFWWYGQSFFMTRLRYPTVIPDQPRHHPGETAKFDVNAPEAGGLFVPMWSLSLAGGVPLAGFGLPLVGAARHGTVPLAPDGVFFATLGQTIVPLGPTGHGFFAWRTPSSPALVGLKLYVSGVRLTPRLTIDWIAGPRSLEFF